MRWKNVFNTVTRFLVVMVRELYFFYEANTKHLKHDGACFLRYQIYFSSCLALKEEA